MSNVSLKNAVGRLVLSRKDGMAIDIGGGIRVTVVRAKKGIAKILIEAPRDIAVNRAELVGRKLEGVVS